MGKVITLTSYRGGIGRTMAAANFAWMLACAGGRVLAVDWNIRAPRLAEFFYPFWPGSDLRKTPGVIDMLWEYVLEFYRPGPFNAEDLNWGKVLSDKVFNLTWEFPRGGSLHVVNAGYFDTYRVRADLFPYNDFFGELGGRAFVENARDYYLSHFDYVLIDAPPILEDVGGLCTQGLADTVAVCFTPFGNEPEAAAAAFSHVQRVGTEHAAFDRLRVSVVPVIMRTERGEAELHSAALEQIDNAFAPLVKAGRGTPGTFRWNELEVPHVPYYAYRQELAYFPAEGGSVLYESYGRVLRHLVGDESFTPPPAAGGSSGSPKSFYDSPPAPLPIRTQMPLYDSSETIGPSTADKNHFFISYKRDEFKRIFHVIAQIQAMGFDVWWDEGIHGGIRWRDVLREKIMSCCAVILFVSKKAGESRWVRDEVAMARDAGKPILPVKLDDPDPKSELGRILDDLQYIDEAGTIPSRKLELALRRLCAKDMEKSIWRRLFNRLRAHT